MSMSTKVRDLFVFRAFPRARAPSTSMIFLYKFKCLRVELVAMLSNKCMAPETPILQWLKSKLIRDLLTFRAGARYLIPSLPIKVLFWS